MQLIFGFISIDYCHRSGFESCLTALQREAKLALFILQYRGYSMNAPTNNPKLLAWVDEITKMTQPDSVVWCDGTKAEYDSLIRTAVEEGLATPLPKRPNSFCSDPIPPMWLALRIAPISHPDPKRMPARPTTGSIPLN